jgi:hypothetical protein
MKLVLDTFCEVYDLIKHYSCAEFWDFAQHDVIPGAVYVIGRQQFKDNRDRILDLVKTKTIKVVYSNPHEGSDVVRGQLMILGINELARTKQILILGGGDMHTEYPCLWFDNFLPKLGDYDENIAAALRADEIYTKTQKPYKFLYLNGRYRPHRKALIQYLEPVLDQAIWSNLDSGNGPVKFLDAKYEFDFYQDRVATTSTTGYVKTELFNNDWGEVYLKPEPYIDTYFSVVPETVFTWPYSFRTEKIWKPVVMGHPFVVQSTQGYYRDMHNIGFRTWGHLIDESFDTIEDNIARNQRIGEVVKDLCQQDLASFITEAAEVCKYNQQHYAEMRLRVRQEFPERFLQFLKQYNFDE